MSVKDEIIRVYKRKVKAHPEGAVVHMGDCHIYSAYLGICTCGLHHWLWQAGDEARSELYPNFLEELWEKSKEGFIEYLLQEFEGGNLYVKDKGEFVKVEKPEPISQEEADKAMNEIEELFKKKREEKNE